MSDVRLTQRGRAGMQFLGQLRGVASAHLRDIARADFAATPPALARVADAAADPAAAPRDWVKRVRQAQRVADQSAAYRFERFYQHFGGTEIFVRGICAIEECRDQIRADDEQTVAAFPDDGTTLELDPALVSPDYVDVEWHTQPGGWDGFDLYGPMFQHCFAPHVFRFGGYAVIETGQQTRFSRQDPLKLLPPGEYRRVYEVGCGTGGALPVARALWPDAELVGGDQSATQLRHGYLMSRRQGLGIQFRQRLAHETREPDNSFDAAISYAFFHELPRAETLKVIAEMFRILRPGGSLVIVDPPPYRAVDLFQSVIMDWESLHHGEPFFSISCASHWAAEMVKIGFSGVQEHALYKRNKYPFVTIGTKPGATRPGGAA